MNFRLSQMPFIRLVAPLTIGIIPALYFHISSTAFYTIILSSFCLLLAWNWYENKNSNYKTRWVFGMLVSLFLIATGYSVTLLKQPFQNHSYFGNYLNDKTDSLMVSVVSSPQQKEKTIKIIGEITAINTNGKPQHTSGKALFYIEKDSISKLIKYGDVLYVNTYLQNVKPPGNPDEFDYKSYLALHGIYHEAYIKAGQYSFAGKNDASGLISFTNRCREHLIALLDSNIKGKEAAVASAILLGYRDDLSQQVLGQFADSGTIHVICVAGLHVGILFWLLGLLLLPLERMKHGKLMRTVILVLLLWLYALFTGMATPVIRATVMFSFLVIGRYFGRYTNNINTLAASAFLVLLINPFQLADAGFQLSYLSVLGIIIIYPKLYNLFEFRNYFIDKLWELACLSISAQMAIVPLSILYFHQFPNYFVFTNLLIVPLLSIVIYSGVLFFLTAHIPLLSTVTAWVLQKSLLLMNAFVDKAHNLPLFVTKGISISVYESLLLYLVLIAFLVFVFTKKYRASVLSLSCFVIFLGIRVYKDYTHSHQQLFVVYDVPKHSAITFISGRQCVTTQPIDSLDFCYNMQCHWWARGVRDSSLLRDTSALLLNHHLYVHHNYAQFNNLKIAFIKSGDIPTTKVKVHYLVLSGNYRQNIAALQNAFIFDKLIFDSSVSAYKLKKWKEECEALHIKYYDVSSQGAFIENT